ncbi:MAG: hypothetical protein ONB31_10705 [candidate division KSB1 bacterium]|nr:hypothetical protein [candidate division KSB1 bacterium]
MHSRNVPRLLEVLTRQSICELDQFVRWGTGALVYWSSIPSLRVRLVRGLDLGDRVEKCLVLRPK